MLKKLAKKAHHYYYKIIIAGVFLVIYPFVIVFAKYPVNFDGMNFMRRILSALTSAFSGIFFKYYFEEKVDWSKTYIICANHSSNLDISAVILLVKRNYVFLGKDELLTNPVTKIYFKAVDIPINRESKISSYRAFKRSQEYLKSGIHVVIFPEGLIGSSYPPVLNPFKVGLFRLAIEQNIPILPVSILNNWKLMWDDGSKFGTKPGISHVIVHKPVNAAQAGIVNADELCSQIFKLINQNLYQ